MGLRIGLGYDIHRTGPGNAVRLGGIEIAAPFSLVGYSDSDVLLHAVIDALLGALGRGDIGQWFPDSDPEFQGIRSVVLCERVMAGIEVPFRIVNLDVTVIAEEPRLTEHKERIAVSVADVFHIDRSQVNIKASTNEGVGEVGRGRAIAVHAVCLAELLEQE